MLEMKFGAMLLALVVVAEAAHLSKLPAFSLVMSGADTRYHLRYGPREHDATDPAEGKHVHTASKSFHSQVIHGAPVPESLGSVVFPIYQTSTFRFESAEDGALCFGGESDGFIYTRRALRRNTPATIQRLGCTPSHEFRTGEVWDCWNNWVG
jgi:hypothetical protein